MTNINCVMEYCKNLIDGVCILSSIQISLGEECGTEFPICINYDEVGRLYWQSCIYCHTVYSTKDDIVITSCGCGENSGR